MTEPSLPELPGRIELSAPADPAIIDLLHGLLEQVWLRHPDVEDADRIRFEMAVVEVLANIVEHAYRLDQPAGDGQRRFTVCLAVTPEALQAAFADNGLPMELDLSRVAMPDEHAESGRGLALAAAALDDLAYSRNDGRNHWRLLCLRGRPR
ncbi:ATP-binding protein [Nocardioides panaciterrulae]|uniref:Serine/threonine-protein kinase RsbW n=1 Tax=Nocardioides panaciterrulae TaxID=661492 RepID=A0A7Y9JAG8_9ACTN|nr:ATP-binding protein [Nocardioides panaciterrulae]NYD41677.1 serine/threonine-protein kinase RsbW [Nocardioides panaciterrulae]